MCAPGTHSTHAEGPAEAKLPCCFCRYAQHQTQQVKNLLEGYRIGNLVSWAACKQPGAYRSAMPVPI